MVRATFAGFQTALSSLQANSKKLDVTTQNLANMNVEGYTRQQLKTSSINYENPVSFYMNENDVNVGFGVSMDAVVQMRDEFLDIQYRDQNAFTTYNSAIETALNTVSKFMDETQHDGLRASMDAIQKALTTMQDTSKVQDPVYEGQLQSDLNSATVLLNSAAKQIKTAEDNEYERLTGEGTSSNGAVETINTLLSEIGDLNKKIKHNQLIGNSALELQDERNLKIDQLSAYIPISVEYFSESYEVQQKNPDGTPKVDGDGNPVKETRYRIYNYADNGRICGKSDWPEDLRITLNYTTKDANGKINNESIILVNGTYKDANGLNYGSVALADDKYAKWTSTDSNTVGPLDTQLTFTSTATDKKGESVTATDITTANSQSKPSDKHVTFSGGSVQASLDMLARSDPTKTATTGLKQGTYYGYDYYMDQLNQFARTLANEVNMYNCMGNNWDYPTHNSATAKQKAIDSIKNGDEKGYENKTFLLLVNRESQTAKITATSYDATTGNFDFKSDDNEITAENISVSRDWINGNTSIGLKGSDSNETVLNLLRSFTQPQASLGDNTFANFVNTLTTRLANDQENNKDTYDTNKAVLTSITSSKDQLSGVSLDEEAANMMTYVSSYNAAAKMMNAFDETLQTLLSIVG
ncbi:flagellar hook-associated protein FlgK [Oribacterium sp. WCC10]|uniref:flagellar hook-associated protein FlgK n=1 Tax=Oribacterium sp. WCC10 TaxID=1855343 RepID=UPI0008EAFB3E|nr:flagellar basal body protein [Oribacterium sp. WCC10]SFG24544.1 flagellar hook-associated protein 1 FlgK [Oribacterium sp. WCC10]